MKIQKPVIEKPVLYLWDTAEPAILLLASPGTWARAAKLTKRGVRMEGFLFVLFLGY